MFETNGTAQTSANTSSSATGSDVSVLYLCDGKVEGCDKAWCFTSQGPCEHTRDVRHARNFSDLGLDVGNQGGTTYIEKKGASQWTSENWPG